MRHELRDSPGCPFPPAKGKGGSCEPGDPACWCQDTEPTDDTEGETPHGAQEEQP